MSARRSEGVRYVARTVEDEPAPTRSISEYVSKEGLVEWPEAKVGDKGLDISNVRFDVGRDLTLGTDTTGGYASAGKQPETYIEATGNRMVLKPMGARVVPVGAEDFGPFPKVTSEGDVYHPVEGAPITAANLQFGIVNPVLRCAGVSANFSRLFRTATGGFAERVVLETLQSRGARALDRDALAGSGVDGEPLGVVNTPGIGSTSGATFSVTTLAELRRILAAAHFVPTAAVGNAATEKILRTRPKATGGEIMLLGDDGKLGGVPFFVTEAMPDATLLLGDFAQLVVLLRSVELNRNPYSKAKDGMVELDLFHFFDVIVRHPAAFCKAVNLT